MLRLLKPCFFKSKETFYAHCAQLLEMWDAEIAQAGDDKRRLAQAYCVRFSLVYQVLENIEGAEFAPRVFKSDASFNSTLAP